MAFVFRLIAGLGITLIVVVVILVFTYVMVALINRGVQWGAENIGGEIGDFFKWLKVRLPKIKIERNIDDKKSESGKTV